jgi:hypothetical protein
MTRKLPAKNNKGIIHMMKQNQKQGQKIKAQKGAKSTKKQ